MLRHAVSVMFLLVCVVQGAPNGTLAKIDVKHINNTFNETVPRQTTTRAFGLPSLFSIRFAPTVCNSNTEGMSGICMTQTDCLSAEGAPSGECAAGFGVCCLIMQGCGKTTNLNSTYFVNPGGPGATYREAGQCRFTVNKVSSNICQLRLDFKKFVLGQPVESNQICSEDYFVVLSGASNQVPVICGENSGQHIYLGITSQTTAWTFGIVTSDLSVTYDRQWTIQLHQIPCDSRVAAPDHCLQYYTGFTGVIKSFNFEFAEVGVPVLRAIATSGRQLANQDYSMCIRTEEDFCSITYRVCKPPTPNRLISSFSLSNGVNLYPARGYSRSERITLGKAPVLMDQGCTTDWLEIPNGYNVNANREVTPSSADRFCGRWFTADPSIAENVPVTSYRKPFQLHLYTDDSETGDSNDNGFCLTYVQNPCPDGPVTVLSGAACSPSRCFNAPARFADCCYSPEPAL